MKLIFAAISLTLITSARAVIFSEMTPQIINRATSSGAGHSPTAGQASTGLGLLDFSQRILSINSITIHGLQATHVGSLTIYLTNPEASMFLHYGGTNGRAINGDVVFRPGTGAPTLSQAILSGSGTIAGSTFTPRDRSVPGVVTATDFRAFEETPAYWGIYFMNSSTAFGASYQGISVDANMATVPEPATMLFLACSFGAIVRRRSSPKSLMR
jgi:hypothetical protein